ncbi:MAG TPA: hypothetical protein VFT65_06010 [Candidatus Angelobacter sp.]|nr:hypothetical protein [Candidatus Angelobacter sp.]
MKKLTFRQHLITSVVCTAAFAMIVACGGGGGGNIIGTVPPPSPTPATSLIAHLFHSSQTGPHSHVVPASAASSPIMASLFFAATPSDIPESIEITCTFAPGFITSVPAGDIVPLVPVSGGSSDCSRFFSGAQPASSLTQLAPLFHAGTVQTLVVSGISAGGTRVRCADLTSQVAVADNDLIPAYLTPSTNTITLFNNTTQMANNCQLTLGAGDTVATLTVRWAKL